MNAIAIDRIREDCHAALQGQSHLLEPLRGESVVVTGGTGFAGTWLAELVAQLNDEYAFGIHLTLVSARADRFRQTRPHLAARRDLRVIQTDVRNLVELPRDTQWLIHAAANPDSRFHSTHPVETMTAIADGTAAVLRAVDRCSDFKMLLNLSSGLVYGPQPLEVERLPETYVGGPASGALSSVYAEAKRYAETLCAAARSQARIPSVNARPFAFIGPYQSIETPWAINNFIRDVLNGHPIRVLGDGKTVRSYMYPSDMAFWYLRMLSAGTAGQSYNVGSPEAVTLESLAHMIAAQVSPRPEIRLQAAPSPAPVSRLVPDVAFAETSLGLRPRVTLQQAIERTIEWNRHA